MKRLSLVLILTAAALNAADLTPAQRAAIDRIQAQRLKADVTFLASDLLEGRGTPSRGLDIAAEFIASQFASAGLEPGGDDGYFQVAKYTQRKQDLKTLSLSIGDIKVPTADQRRSVGAIPSIGSAGAYKLDMDHWREQLAAGNEAIRGRVVLALYPDFRSIPADKRNEFMRNMTELDSALRTAGVALIVTVGGMRPVFAASLYPAGSEAEAPLPSVGVDSKPVREMFDKAAPGPLDAKVTVDVASAELTPVTIRNVVGVIRGSDPVLKDTCILVSGHYDHLGINTAASSGDRIFNGANDDASGTSSVMEIAAALATLNPRPRRSIVFVAFFGEEIGGLGAQWYTQHPTFPLDKTVANLNLEHMGRTDQTEGPRVGTATITGYEYSSLHTTFEQAAALTNWKFADDPPRSNDFFARSDNVTLARKGVVAHTVSVAYIFPDYHRVSDEANKLDYENMAGADRCVAAAVLLLAGSDEVPHWADLPATAPYRQAAEKLHPSGTH